MKYRIPGMTVFGLAIAMRAALAAGPDYLADAENLVAKGDLKAAEIQLKNALRSDPKNMAAHYRLAVIQLQLGNAPAAEYEARTAQAAGYDPEHTVPLLAQTYLAQQKYQALLQDFPGEQGSPAERAGVLVARGYAQLALGRREEGQASFSQAQKLAPQDPAPLLAEAKLLLADRKISLAEPLYDRVLTLSPDSSEALIGKAHVLRLNGNIEQALSILNKLLSGSPGYIPGRIERAEILVTQGKDSEAKADIDAVFAIQPGNILATYLEALLAGKNKDFQKANLNLQRISSALGSIPRGYYVQAVVQYNLQQFEQAEDAARRYAVRNPDDLAGQKLLGLIALQLKRPADTIKALAKFESEGKIDVQALDLLGRAYNQVGKSAEALAAFTAAVKLAPEDPVLRMRLGGTQLRVGNQEQGIADLEHSLEIAPLTPAAEVLVLTEIAAGRWEQATEAANKLKQKEPNSPVAGNLLGIIAQARFDLESARATFADLGSKNPEFLPARLNLARVLELQGKTDQAEDVLQQALKQRPSDFSVLSTLTDLLARNGKADAAIAIAERARTASPNNASVTAKLIDLYLARGDKEKALSIARSESTKSEPSDIPIIAARARAELAAGLKNEAAQSFRRLTEIDKSNISYRRQLAALLSSGGDNDEAKRVIDDAMQIDPRNSELAGDRIALEFKISGTAGAIATANRLRETNPDLRTAAALEGDVRMVAQQYTEAAESYAKALQKAPSSLLVVRLATAKSSAGKPDDGVAVLRDWLKSHPDDKEVLAELGMLELTAHRYEEAQAAFENVVQTMSRNPILLNNLAWLYARSGDKRARSLAERAHLIAPNVPQIKDTLGWILAEQGEAPTAVRLLQEASAAGHSGPDVRYHLAVALNAAGRRAEALKILAELVKDSTNFDEKPAAEKLFAELSKG